MQLCRIKVLIQFKKSYWQQTSTYTVWWDPFWTPHISSWQFVMSPYQQCRSGPLLEAATSLTFGHLCWCKSPGKVLCKIKALTPWAVEAPGDQKAAVFIKALENLIRMSKLNTRRGRAKVITHNLLGSYARWLVAYFSFFFGFLEGKLLPVDGEQDGSWLKSKIHLIRS